MSFDTAELSGGGWRSSGNDGKLFESQADIISFCCHVTCRERCNVVTHHLAQVVPGWSRLVNTITLRGQTAPVADGWISEMVGVLSDADVGRNV